METIATGINTFCQELEYDEITKGYWIYDHVFLQLEECTDILKAIHPGIDFIFLLYHPCRSDIVTEDILNGTNMNSGYGKTQLEMIPINIKQGFGCLGLHERII